MRSTLFKCFSVLVFAVAHCARAEENKQKPASPLEVLSLKPAPADGYPAGTQRLEYRSGVDRVEDWACLLPPEAKSHTWVVYLHGHGSGGEQLFTRPDVRDGVLGSARKQGWGAAGPNLRGNAWMSPAAATDLHGLIQLLHTKFGAERIILVGGSMGGTGVLAYGVLHPDDAAAIIALCPAPDIGAFHGWCRERKTDAKSPPVLQELADAIEKSFGGPPAKLADVFAKHSALARGHERLTMPVFVSHGSADAIIPVEQARKLAENMRDRKTFQYHELPGAGHDGPLRDMDAAMKFILPKLEEAEKKNANPSTTNTPG